MQFLARTSLLLVILLMVLSAYLRLDHSGIGCEPWPQCYGNIGTAAEEPNLTDTYERLVMDARQPLSWATPLHRLVASILGLLVLAMTFVSLRRKQDRAICVSLLGMTVFLAWLGIYSAGLHSPAVVMGNLCGGFLMLSVLGWLVLRKDTPAQRQNKLLRNATAIAIIVLGLQIVLGGLTSANFAASACQTLPDCHGSWLPGDAITSAFDLSRSHRIGEFGNVLGGAERSDIHKLHRLVALLTTITVIFAGIIGIRQRGDLLYVGLAAVLLVILEMGLGAAAILAALPIGMAVAHNWIAAMLFLVMLKLYSESTAGSE